MRLRIAAIFGLFEAAMPLAGLAIGRTAIGDFGGHGGVVAGVVLCLAGGYALIESVRSRGTNTTAAATTRPRAPGPRPSGHPRCALSLDNLAVGFALGAYQVSVSWLPWSSAW